MKSLNRRRTAILDSSDSSSEDEQQSASLRIPQQALVSSSAKRRRKSPVLKEDEDSDSMDTAELQQRLKRGRVATKKASAVRSSAPIRLEDTSSDSDALSDDLSGDSDSSSEAGSDDTNRLVERLTNRGRTRPSAPTAAATPDDSNKKQPLSNNHGADDDKSHQQHSSQCEDDQDSTNTQDLINRLTQGRKHHDATLDKIVDESRTVEPVSGPVGTDQYKNEKQYRTEFLLGDENTCSDADSGDTEALMQRLRPTQRAEPKPESGGGCGEQSFGLQQSPARPDTVFVLQHTTSDGEDSDDTDELQRRLQSSRRQTLHTHDTNATHSPAADAYAGFQQDHVEIEIANTEEPTNPMFAGQQAHPVDSMNRVKDLDKNIAQQSRPETPPPSFVLPEFESSSSSEDETDETCSEERCNPQRIARSSPQSVANTGPGDVDENDEMPPASQVAIPPAANRTLPDYPPLPPVTETHDLFGSDDNEHGPTPMPKHYPAATHVTDPDNSRKARPSTPTRHQEPARSMRQPSFQTEDELMEEAFFSGDPNVEPGAAGVVGLSCNHRDEEHDFHPQQDDIVHHGLRTPSKSPRFNTMSRAFVNSSEGTGPTNGVTEFAYDKVISNSVQSPTREDDIVEIFSDEDDAFEQAFGISSRAAPTVATNSRPMPVSRGVVQRQEAVQASQQVSYPETSERRRSLTRIGAISTTLNGPPRATNENRYSSGGALDRPNRARRIRDAKAGNRALATSVVQRRSAAQATASGTANSQASGTLVQATMDTWYRRPGGPARVSVDGPLRNDLRGGSGVGAGSYSVHPQREEVTEAPVSTRGKQTSYKRRSKKGKGGKKSWKGGKGRGYYKRKGGRGGRRSSNYNNGGGAWSDNEGASGAPARPQSRQDPLLQHVGGADISF